MSNDLPTVQEKPNMRFDYQYEERTPQPEAEPIPPTPSMQGYGTQFISYQDDSASSPPLIPSSTEVLAQEDFRLPPLSSEAMAYSNDEVLTATVAYKQAVDEHLASPAVTTPEVDYETVTWKEIEAQRRHNVERELTKRRSMISLFRLKKELLCLHVAMCSKSMTAARQQMEAARAEGIAHLIDAGLAPPLAERQVNNSPKYIESFSTHSRESYNHDACQKAYHTAHKDLERWSLELRDFVDGLRNA